MVERPVTANVADGGNGSGRRTRQAAEDEFTEGIPRLPSAEFGEMQSEDRFSEQNSDSESESATPGLSKNNSRVLPRRQFTKLEVVQAHQIEKLMLCQHVFVSIGILFTVICVILTSVVYDSIFSPGAWGGKLALKVFYPPSGLKWFTHISAFCTFIYAVCLAFVYSFRILSLKTSDRTHEQVWVIGLLLSLAAYLIPWTDFYKIHDQLLTVNFQEYSKLQKAPWFDAVSTLFMLIRQISFTFTTVFYVWASVHSYRLLETDINVMFYLPKVITLVLYVACKVMVWFEFKILAAEMMFTSFFGMVSTYGTAKRWLTPGVWYGCVSLLFELALGAYIFREVLVTKDVLKKADYLQYRTKQIGFRFFIYHNIIFYFMFWALYMTLLLGVPYGFKAFQVVIAGESNFETHDFMFGIQVMLLSYATVEAYANLPADALGFIGWFVPQTPKGAGDISELQPITYRKREPPSLKGVVSDLNVNCFVMQTHVTMFNFAWLVYYWDTPKVEDFKLTQDVFKFSVAQYIKDKPTDTHVLVIDGADRIVIAFKGTTSTKNLKTDINMFYSNARGLLPTQLGEVDPDGDAAALANPILKEKAWRWAKVHKGFAVAYGAVGPMLLKTVKQLQEERRRPVFLTGHSLGGALATVCSIDLHLRLGMTRREIFVSTFGAPRVGNHSFCSIYDEYVPIHWRIVVGPDVVAKLPKIGFTHVGKKVLITVDGDLFIDPNSLELNLWSGDVASILYHRKASYLLAMRAWCERHHGDEYLPEFWPFPVSKDDTRRFEHAMVRSMSQTSQGLHDGPLSGRVRERPLLTKRSRLRQLDAMIEALEGPNGPVTNPDAVQQWSRLTRAVLVDVRRSSQRNGRRGGSQDEFDDVEEALF
jgi:triacylglycerol lipase